MTRLVVDASVAVKWFLPEVHSLEAMRLLDGNHELLAPDLLTSELGNILWKKVRRAELQARLTRGCGTRCVQDRCPGSLLLWIGDM